MRDNMFGLLVTTLLIWLCFFMKTASSQDDKTPKEYLDQLLKVLPAPRYNSLDDTIYGISGIPAPHVSPDDFSWDDWLERTGELPPDFDELPSLPFLPNPLIIDEGGENIPVTTIEQWQKKRTKIKEQVQHWITGTVPPPPENLQIEVLEERVLGSLTERMVLLKFGPGHQAELHVTLLIPPGDGPFPVFICPWKKNRYDWVQAAVRRGYIGCRFTATDPKYGYPDDTEKYEELWWPEYDFSALMRWGWAASRAIDYLHTLDQVNTNQIALTGLSRNGKMALWAAAFDERIKAVIPISGGTGGEDPFRYTSEKFDNESIKEITNNFPNWLHPRLRFFVGRENKLPVDQNSLMALIAPRGLMLTSSVFENQGNPWGIEQAYLSAQKAYKFLGAEDKIAIDLRYGLHAPSARDMEKYLDFFDYIFGRGCIKPDNKLFYGYSFSKWLGLSEEMVNPLSYSKKGIDDLLVDSENKDIKLLSSWNSKVEEIRQQIKWALGVEPPSLAPGIQPDYMRKNVVRPKVQEDVKSEPIGFGTLYYPAQYADRSNYNNRLPVVIYLHEYSYPTGYGRNFQPLLDEMIKHGFAVYAMDQIGFGTRIEEGRLFYNRFPHWSKMGRMVADTRWAVDELLEKNEVDPDRIYLVGYSLGGTIGLYSAALDERIAGVVSVCGFTPMRVDTPNEETGVIRRYSHLHGLLPRIGFFVDEEKRIPYDFHEILACIAPRPLFIISPSWDQYSNIENVKKCVKIVKEIYDLYGEEQNLDLSIPDDYNRFSPVMQEQALRWLEKQKLHINK